MAVPNNRTLDILRKAEEGGSDGPSYDGNMALALVRAAEAQRSPAILQLFPITVKHGGGEFLRYCLDVAHNASVPISVHLDHATDEEALELSVGLAEKGIAFDSIMVDASHADTEEENIAIAVPWIKRCNAAGVATEVELGRLEGGEAGLRVITGAMLTDPTKAEAFMKATGADILAPSIGNLHGLYDFVGGPNFKQDILKELQSRFKGRTPYICLLPDELFKECIKNGVTKINVNSWCRDPYAETMAKSLATKPFPDAVDDAMAAFQAAVERLIKVFGSDGKA